MGYGTATAIIKAHSFAQGQVYGNGAGEPFPMGDDAVGSQGKHLAASDPAFTCHPIDIRNHDSTSIQLFVDPDTRTIAITAGDTITASTKTFVIAAGAFTAADVGATVTFAGATNAGNNHAFVISAVTNATTVVATTASGLVDETLNPAAVTLSLTRALLSGAWSIAVSNDYVPAGNGSYGASPGAGHWSDITSAFVPAIVAVVGATGSNQFTLADICVRSMRITFTPA